MPWTERRTITLEIYPNAVTNEPDRLYLSFDGPEPSLLSEKQIGRVFLAFRPGTTWDEADALTREMRAKLPTLCIVHQAGGEDYGSA